MGTTKERNTSRSSRKLSPRTKANTKGVLSMISCRESNATAGSVYVTGGPALALDSRQEIIESTPLVFAFVLGLSFLLLLLVFRSLVVPIKAILMNLLSVGAAYGMLVLVFQQVGFGLAMAVLLDATIVRMVMVPASMALLGRLNWYLPSWLDWLPRVNI